MQRPATQTPTTTQSDSVTHRIDIDSHRSRSPSAMAATTERSSPFTLPHIAFRDQRPTLPPLTNLEFVADRHATSPLITPPISRGNYDPFNPFSRPKFPQTSPTDRSSLLDTRPPPSPFTSIPQASESRDPFRQSQHPTSPHDPLDNPLKRSFVTMAQGPSR